MRNLTAQSSQRFFNVIKEIPHVGYKQHASEVIKYAYLNSPYVKKSIKEIPGSKGHKKDSAIIISAGPSVRKKNSIKRIQESGYKGTLIAADGAYIACLQAGLIPDFVITLDPHPTRIVRWFGDPHFEKHSAEDDYFTRQDLDIEFRKHSIAHNKENIALVDHHAPKTKALVATSIAPTLLQRLLQAKFDLYWWNPLVDNPDDIDSITKKLYSINKVPCMNTGGTVGTAAWVFAATRLNIKHIAVVGMDYGYYHDTPLTQTQTFYELIKHVGTDMQIEDFFIKSKFPLTGEEFYTDPTYYWYKQNFLELIREVSGVKTYNCTEGGTLQGDEILCVRLDDFLQSRN